LGGQVLLSEYISPDPCSKSVSETSESISGSY
jgi:hypothetical protein